MSKLDPLQPPAPEFIEWIKAHRAADVARAKAKVAKETAQRIADEEAGIAPADAAEDYECPHCRGTGEGQIEQQVCMYCKGRGY